MLLPSEFITTLGGSAYLCVFMVSFVLTFFSALGRGFLLKKPPILHDRLVDAFMCGVLAIPLTGLLMIDYDTSVWWTWTACCCFGTMGFLVFYEMIRDVLPRLKDALVGRLIK